MKTDNNGLTKVELRDGERFRFFLALTAAQRTRWCSLYATPRALRTAIDNALRAKQ